MAPAGYGPQGADVATVLSLAHLLPRRRRVLPSGQGPDRSDLGGGRALCGRTIPIFRVYRDRV